MVSTCIRHPENNRYIQINEWQIKFCQNNHCAALLLSFLSAWHDWKIKNDQYYRRSNDIAEMHGDPRSGNENAYLFFSLEQLIEGCMGFYGKRSITEAILILESTGAIITRKNPNPRYHFDKTKYFKFYPGVCNRWIAENYPINDEKNDDNSQLLDFTDEAKVADALSKNALPSDKNSIPSCKNARYITNTTNNTTNNNKSINTQNDFVSETKKIPTQNEEGNAEIQLIVETLTVKGLPAKHINHPDTVEIIQQLCRAGATVALFAEAYKIADQSTNGNFNMRYLEKVLYSLLKNEKQNKSNTTSNETKNSKNYYDSMDMTMPDWM